MFEEALINRINTLTSELQEIDRVLGRGGFGVSGSLTSSDMRGIAALSRLSSASSSIANFAASAGAMRLDLSSARKGDTT